MNQQKLKQNNQKVCIQHGRRQSMIRDFRGSQATVKRATCTLLLRGMLIAAIALIVPGSVLVALFAPQIAQAQTPNTTVNFQARILTSAGAIVPDGNYHIEFKLYDSVGSGASAQGVCSLNSSTDDCWWLETRSTGNLVRVVNGYISVNLGSVTAFGSSIPWSQDLYVSMRVGGTSGPSWDSEMTNGGNRMKLNVAPLALVSNNVRTANRTSTASDNITIQTGNTTTSGNSGNVAIDVGTAASTAGTISLGSANASALSLGRTSITTTNVGALIVTQLTTLNGGLTVETGDTFTFNGDAFTDLTGTGLTISTGALTVDSTSATGAFINGGNAFTANATLGINANYDLNVETNSLTRLTVQADGDVAVDTDTLFVNATDNNVVIGGTTRTANESLTVITADGRSGIVHTNGTVAVGTAIGFNQAYFGTDTNHALLLYANGVDSFGINTSNTVFVGSTATGATLASGLGDLLVQGNLEVKDKTLVTGAVTDAVEGSLLLVTGTSTSTTNNQYGASLEIVAAPASASIRHFAGASIYASTTSANLTGGTLTGSYNGAINDGTGTVNKVQGIVIETGNGSTGTINLLKGINVWTPNNVSGTITNAYGISIDDQTAGTNDYGLAIEGADTYAFWLGSGADNTDAANGITFGLSGDTNLYRSAANTLRTDDSLSVGGTLAVTGNTTLTGDLAVNGNDITTGAGDLTITPAGGDTIVTGTLTVTTSATVNGLLTGTLGATISGATTNLNVSSNFGTNINTGTSTGAVSIGNSLAGVTTIQGAASATALRVLDASSAPIITVDSAARSGSGGNLLKVGNSTGTDTATTILQLDSATAVPTTNLSALNGGLFYNSTTNKVSIIENGVVKVVCNSTDASCGGNSTTLQQSYDADADGSDATIALTSTDGSLILSNPSSGGSTSAYILNINQLATGAVGGLDVQSAGTGNLFRVRDTTATAADVLTIADGGATTFKNQTNSSSAFQIQNAAGVIALTVDTTPINSLVPNPGFELVSSGTTLTNWTASGTGASVVQNTTEHYINTASAAFTTGTAVGNKVSVQLGSALSTSTTYTLSFYLKSNTYTTFVSASYTAAGTGATETDCAYISSTSNTTAGWTRYTCTINTPASGITSSNTINIKQSDASSKIFYIDGVQLEAGSAITNGLVANTGFETGVTGWTAYGTGASRAQTASAGTFYNGADGLSISTTTGNPDTGVKYTTANTNPTQLATSTAYQISFLAKASGSNFSTLNFGYSRDGTTRTDCSSGQTVVTTDWTRYTCNFTTDGTSPAAGAFIYFIQSDSATRTFYLDDVQVVAQLFIAAPSAYRETALQLNGTVTSRLAVQNASDSTEALTVKNVAGNSILSVDTVNGIVVVASGSASTKPMLVLTDSSGNETLHLTGIGSSYGLGYNVLGNLTSTTGENIAIGAYSQQSSTGGQNTSLGTYTLAGNTTGSYNTAVGKGALQQNQDGIHNTALGLNTLYNNISGSSNVALGSTALNATTGDGNIGVGLQAGMNITSGSYNIAIGYNVQVASAAGSDQLNIGDTLYGDLANDRIAVGTSTVSTNRFTTDNAATADNILVGRANGSDVFTIGSTGLIGAGLAPVTGRQLSVNGVLALSTSASARLQISPTSGGTQNLWNIDNTAGTLRIFRENYSATGIGAGGVVRLSVNESNSADGLAIDYSAVNATSQTGVKNTLTVLPTSSAGSSTYDAEYVVATASSNAFMASAYLNGAHYFAKWNGTTGNTLLEARGFISEAHNVSTGTIGTATGAILRVTNASTGTINEADGLRISSLTNGSGTVTNNYAIYLENQTAGTNDYGLFIAGADTNPIKVQNGSAVDIFTINQTGSTLHKTTSNSATAFAIQNTSSVSYLNVDTTGTGTSLTVVNNSTGNGQNISLTNTSGTQTAGLSIDRNGAAGITTSLLSLSQTAGTATNGILFNGTIGTDINTATNRALVITANGTGGITLGNSTASNTVNIANANTLTGNTQTINIGAGTPAGTGLTNVTIGNILNGGTLNLNSGTGNINLQAGGTSTIARVQIGAGGAGNATPDFLGLDVKSTTGDPAGGAEGFIYYNTFDNKFRCFQGVAWADCISSGSASALQASYDIDADNSDTRIDLTTADDSLIFSNPTSSGTDSGFVLKVEQLNTGIATDALTVSNSGTGDLLEFQDAGTAVLRIGDGGNILGANTTTGTTATTSGTGTDTTTLVFTGTTSFANNDIILIDNAGQDYYTRIVSGGTAASVTVSPAVTFETGRTVTKYIAQNIGRSSYSATNLQDRFFEGYFLGGVVTGAGSTTLSDGSLVSTNSLNFRASGNLTVGVSDTTGTLFVLDTKTGSGDPTCVNGGMYYNSNSASFRVCKNSAWVTLVAGVDIQNFTANGTWTRPSGTSVVMVVMCGGGGSGGGIGGTRGGSGGGGGAYVTRTFSASDTVAVGATVSVTVAASVAGGASGANGNAGNYSAFGTLVTAYGGGGGIFAGGANTSGGGGGGMATAGGNGGSNTDSAGGENPDISLSFFELGGVAGAGWSGGGGVRGDVGTSAQMGGGAGGGGITSNGRAGGGSISGGGGGGGGTGSGGGGGTTGGAGGGTGIYTSGGGGAGGINASGTAGSAGNSTHCGTGGGGGGAGAARNGGDGGAPGGGGGGGGGTSGAGGAGARGEVWVYSW